MRLVFKDNKGKIVRALHPRTAGTVEMAIQEYGRNPSGDTAELYIGTSNRVIARWGKIKPEDKIMTLTESDPEYAMLGHHPEQMPGLSIR